VQIGSRLARPVRPQTPKALLPNHVVDARYGAVAFEAGVDAVMVRDLGRAPAELSSCRRDRPSQ
jgi:hypothetical protein